MLEAKVHQLHKEILLLYLKSVSSSPEHAQATMLQRFVQYRLTDPIKLFFSLFCTAAILHILCRIILHLNRMKNAHLYVHMYVCTSRYGCDNMKLVHFGYITHNL